MKPISKRKQLAAWVRKQRGWFTRAEAAAGNRRLPDILVRGYLSKMVAALELESRIDPAAATRKGEPRARYRRNKVDKP